jgi:hypothetical protein
MKIHFVWLGKNQGAHCTATALAAEKACPGHEIWLWVLKENAGEFTTPLKGTKVQILLLDSSQGPLGGADWVKDGFKVISTLREHKAWAAAKDLAVLMILHKYGGLYMDTSCMLATDVELKKYASSTGGKSKTITEAVKSLEKSSDVALPLVETGSNDKVAYQPGCFTNKAISIGYDSTDKKNKTYDMPHVDVWAYYSPAGHKIFLGAIESYIKRAQTIGLDSKDSKITFGRDELKGDFRDGLIGQLISQSIMDGLAGKLGVKPDAIRKLCWKATGFKDKPTNLFPGTNMPINADIVPELGIIKQYRGSWRKT